MQMFGQEKTSKIQIFLSPFFVNLCQTFDSVVKHLYGSVKHLYGSVKLFQTSHSSTYFIDIIYGRSSTFPPSQLCMLLLALTFISHLNLIASEFFITQKNIWPL